jgi:hypothetical protein
MVYSASGFGGTLDMLRDALRGGRQSRWLTSCRGFCLCGPLSWYSPRPSLMAMRMAESRIPLRMTSPIEEVCVIFSQAHLTPEILHYP